MAYLKGAADMARPSCDYMSPAWLIANLVGIAAGTFLALLSGTRDAREGVDTAFTEASVRRLVTTYRAE